MNAIYITDELFKELLEKPMICIVNSHLPDHPLPKIGEMVEVRNTKGDARISVIKTEPSIINKSTDYTGALDVYSVWLGKSSPFGLSV